MWKQCVLNHDLRHGVGGVSEFEGKTDIPGRVYPMIRSPERGVNGDASRVEFNAGLFETKAIDIRGASYANQNIVDRQLKLCAIVGCVMDYLLMVTELDGTNFKPGQVRIRSDRRQLWLSVLAARSARIQFR